MSYNPNSLKLIESFGSVGPKGQGVYYYATNDTKAMVEDTGYFNAAAKLLNVGDAIEVVGDLDGTPFKSGYTVSGNSGGVVALTENSAVTQNVLQVVQVRVPVLGTASAHFVASPVAGSVSKVMGVSNANGASATGTVTVSVPGTGAIATLPFPAGYTAGSVIEDSTITPHLDLAAGGLITVAGDGGGDGTGEVIVTLVITPS